MLGIEALLLAVAGWGLGWWEEGQSTQPEGWTSTVYRGPALDVADGLAGLTLVVAGLTLLPNLALHVRTAWPAAALLSAAGAWLIGAWVRGSFERTWAASATILLMLVHTFVYCLPGWLEQPWLDSVLLHATIGVAATLACQFGLRSRSEPLRVVCTCADPAHKPVGGALVGDGIAAPAGEFLGPHAHPVAVPVLAVGDLVDRRGRKPTAGIGDGCRRA